MNKPTPEPSSGSLFAEDDLPPSRKGIPESAQPPVPTPMPVGGTAEAAGGTASRIAQAMALLWTYRPRTTVYKLLSLLEWKRDDGRRFTQDDVKQAIAELRRQNGIVDMPHRDGFFRLRDDVRATCYRDLLEGTPVATLRDALACVDFSSPSAAYHDWPIYDSATAVARLRLELFSGAPASDIERFRGKLSHGLDWSELVWAAAVPSFDAALFERVVQEWRWNIAYMAVSDVNRAWNVVALPVCEWALAKVDDKPQGAPEPVRYMLAELSMHRGDPARAQRAIAGLSGGGTEAMRAYGLLQSGAFAEAQAAFEAALKLRQTEAAARKRVLPSSIAWLYPLALLAQQTPRHLELARKFCAGEAGSRTPDPHHGWGRWVHAIDVRLGDKAAGARTRAEPPAPVEHVTIDDLWHLLLDAWVGSDASRASGPSQQGVARLAAALRARLDPLGFAWIARQVDAAAAILSGAAPPPAFFVSGPRERWRDVLAALQALETTKGSGDSDTGASRLVWSIHLDKRGKVEAIQPLEQKSGLRGYGKAKAVSLSKVSGNLRLPPWDAKVARAIGKDRYDPRHRVLDRAAAIMALVGHPAVVLAEAPEQVVDVVEGSAELDVVQDANGFRMRVTPSVHPSHGRDDDLDPGLATDRETSALRMITVVQDSPTRVRVIRLTPAQQRAAQLVAGAFRVPANAQQELQQALRALATHFQVHDDHAQAAREIDTDSRLRAELSPSGQHLALRLVVAPLGAEGPRVAPGVGRARLMASIGGEAIGTRRDHAKERASLAAVLDALPFLDEPDASGACEWVIADAEQALGAVERLPTLPAIAAVEWPKGKPVRVITVDAPKLGLVVRGDRDWFRIEGRAVIDESAVLDFEAVLAAAQSKSRFVPMGDGMYAALSQSLKTRLADLAAVAESDRHGVRVPRVSALWLDEALEGAQLDADDGFRDAIERLRRAQDESVPVPKTLQAELRPYQEDGYRWAMRLASAGLGGCLADDMGLGKTLQGLAVLLARGAQGAALVIAPTSVCGNWLAEARRFAPTLNVALYGDAERESTLASAGAMDVIVVSYTLMLQAKERFAARRWHTVIADEAQAIKNAAAKRSQAAFELDTDFRLALSGTPVENRLAELWSIMRFANPGLLGTSTHFGERFAGPIERDRDRDAQQRLKRLIGPFVLRRTKAQVLQELPARTELLLAVAPSATEATHYEALRRQAVVDADRALAAEPSGQARLNILVQLTRLRRAACDPRLVTPELGVAGAKVQAFADLAADLVANGHKALVFSQFVDFLTLLRAPLDAAGVAYQYLDGSTPADERTRRVAAFQAGQGDLFLISLKAGGFGLNLTAADYVLITDPWWNPAAEDQAMGRAHRIGQNRPVTVYRLVTKGTVEERIVALHQEKRALADSILAEGEATQLPTADELVALLRGT